MVAEFAGSEILRFSDEEMESLASAIAKVAAARGTLPRAERRLKNHGPWMNFVFVLAAIYGPRLFLLWKAWEADRARRKKRVLSVVPASDQQDSEIDPAIGSDKAVN